MSWDSYIDNMVAQTKDSSGTAHCDRAVIIGLDGGAAWTTPTHACGLKISPQEGASVAACFKSGKYDSFMANGIHLEGDKYQFLRAMDDKTVMAKRKGCGAVTIQKSKTAVVIGHCPEGGQQGNLNKGVNVIAEYLESVNM